MPKFSSKRRVRHTAPQMFDLVADVERYAEVEALAAQVTLSAPKLWLGHNLRFRPRLTAPP
jgi:ribosome-associated toxin RatA of RatAB toxin-antitoxin module